MEPKCWEVVRGERGFGGSGEYSDENDAHLDLIGVFYHEASGGKYLPRAVRLDLNSKSPLGEPFSRDNLMGDTRGQKLGQRPFQEG
jgi:tubulin beta